MQLSEAEGWLTREDQVCHEARVQHLEWLATLVPEKEYLSFPGGLLAKQLYEEARYCFAYAQFLASITLGMAYVEHTLAALLYGAGRSDLERAGISELLQEAVDLNWLNEDEVQHIEHAKRLRNGVVHFRRPGDKRGIESRSVEQNAPPYDILETDARYVMTVVFRLLARGAA